MHHRTLVTLFPFALVCSISAATIEIQMDKSVHPVPSTLWGIFFEDINLSADGGLYPELVRNRSFEDADRPEYWTFTSHPEGKSEAAIDSAQPLNPMNRHSLRIKMEGSFRLENHGYWGMNFAKGAGYT